MNLRKVWLLLLIGTLGLVGSAQAIPTGITLADPLGPNSTVKIDPTSQSGIYNWLVDGTNQLAQSAFWYRTDATGVASPVSSLTYSGTDLTGTDQATVHYTGTDLDLTIDYILMGGDLGSGTSDLQQTVTITNKSASSLTLHLFGYYNFDINGTAPGEVATRISSSTIEQTEGSAKASVAVNPVASHWEAGDAATLLNKLNSVSFTNLADATSPYTGDAAFAFQWDAYVARNGSWSTSPELQVSGAKVPEPSGLAVLLMNAIGALSLVKRRRR